MEEIKKKINWKVRFRNKAWLASVAALVITFVYGMLEAFEVVPSVSEYRVGQIIQGVLTVLGLLGVVIDPTTAGVEDSNRAMGYEHPWNDDVDWDGTSETDRVNGCYIGPCSGRACFIVNSSMSASGCFFSNIVR